MDENKNEEHEISRQKASGCRDIVEIGAWGCLISLVLFFVIGGYFANSVLQNRKALGANSTAGSEAKNAYFFAQKYFADHPSGELSLSLLHQYGYQNSDKITLTIVDGKRESLKLKSEHQEGTKVYLVDHKGTLTIKKSKDND